MLACVCVCVYNFVWVWACVEANIVCLLTHAPSLFYLTKGLSVDLAGQAAAGMLLSLHPQCLDYRLVWPCLAFRFWDPTLALMFVWQSVYLLGCLSHPRVRDV